MNCYLFNNEFVPLHAVASWYYEITGEPGRRMANLSLYNVLGRKFTAQWSERTDKIYEGGFDALQSLIVK